MLNLKRTSKLILSSVLIVALVPACDKQDDSKEAKQAPEKSEQDKELERRLAANKAEREAKAKAVKDKANAIKALAKLPEKMPKDLEAACTGVGEAQDAFMQKHYDGEGLAKWNAAKGGQMAMLKAGCIKQGNIEIAACQSVAMASAPGEYKKDLPDILAACIEKFRKQPGDAAAPKPG